ncbi:MAG TPA: hypothetical protein VFE47_23455, partial [Tepidisphaeraceae bacterium]|nr:hypothetical protein [Tepidisphaeraceae bacterium]
RRAKDFRAVRLITGDGCDLVCFGFNDGLKSDLSVPIVLNRPVLFRGSNPVASYAQSDPDRLPGSFWNGDKMFPEVLICGSLSRAQLYWCGDAFRGDGEKAILTRYGRGSHDILCVRYESPDREPQGIVTSFSLIPSMADDDVLDPYLQVTFGDSGRDPALVAIPQDGSSPDLSELPEWLHAHFLR